MTVSWIIAFTVAIAIFVLAAEDWGFRVAFGGFVLLCFFVYMALV